MLGVLAARTEGGDGLVEAKQRKFVERMFGSRSFKNAIYLKNSACKLSDGRCFL